MRVVTLSFIAVLLASSAALAETRPRPAPAKAPTAVSLTVVYQRVGREVMKLQDQRGFFDTSDLVPRFKSIKLEQALATPAARIALATTLAELASKIERMRGIQLEQACLDNPLAATCQ